MKTLFFFKYYFKMKSFSQKKKNRIFINSVALTKFPPMSRISFEPQCDVFCLILIGIVFIVVNM